MSNPFAGFERNAFMPERYMPRIEGFDEHSGLTGAEVKSVIKELIPSKHLEGCPSITCNPDYPVWAEYPNAFGGYRWDTNEIILRGREFFEEAGKSEVSTVFHEIGHNAHNRLMENNPQAAAQWTQLHQSSLIEHGNSGFGFVSDYARTDELEDFAESYKNYIENPMLLEFMSPEKYAFMEQHVYDGRKYGQVYMVNGETTTLEKSVADALREAIADDGAGYETTSIALGGEQKAVSDTFRCFNMVG